MSNPTKIGIGNAKDFTIHCLTVTCRWIFIGIATITCFCHLIIQPVMAMLMLLTLGISNRSWYEYWPLSASYALCVIYNAITSCIVFGILTNTSNPYEHRGHTIMKKHYPFLQNINFKFAVINVIVNVIFQSCIVIKVPIFQAEIPASIQGAETLNFITILFWIMAGYVVAVGIFWGIYGWLVNVIKEIPIVKQEPDDEPPGYPLTCPV